MTIIGWAQYEHGHQHQSLLPDQDATECLIPDNIEAGLGKKEILCVYRPLLDHNKNKIARF